MTWLAQQILTELARVPFGLTLDGLGRRLDRPAADLVMACATLHRRELIARVGKGGYFILDAGRALLAEGKTVRSGSAHGRRPKVSAQTLRHRVWHALAHRKKATLDELLTVACAGGERDPERNIRRYLRLLERTGYLVRLRDRQPDLAPTSPGHVKWLLLRWTGPKAPVSLQRGTALYDPNLRRAVVPSPPAPLPPEEGGEDVPSPPAPLPGGEGSRDAAP
ncbi:MAG: hypothetical protein RKR03_09085 [Candidatus Competibacter sp.]|nr:hypothetical protein [Candidatus Competibacter sp.]